VYRYEVIPSAIAIESSSIFHEREAFEQQEILTSQHYEVIPSALDIVSGFGASEIAAFCS
jgi:hypothetical protein